MEVFGGDAVDFLSCPSDFLVTMEVADVGLVEP